MRLQRSHALPKRFHDVSGVFVIARGVCSVLVVCVCRARGVRCVLVIARGVCRVPVVCLCSWCVFRDRGVCVVCSLFARDVLVV